MSKIIFTRKGRRINQVYFLAIALNISSSKTLSKNAIALINKISAKIEKTIPPLFKE
ncbi:hypothetical protein [Nostoc sp. UHCC 0252]|uniref:hypothetical protein n=1 Tax=Nostoc sp. UHCC 0252 TaxID=3110241 RepID=UPI002B1FB8B4|nr:hypothetical protein [Nostoc sp. UHCC 0252]MEA5605574.1 hypothetical protein [Nostoc sp. UHCC 0252]